MSRDHVAVLLAIVTVGCLGLAFLLSKGSTFLMPGPLASAHGAIETCSACHTRSGSGKLSWLHGLVAGDPLADSKACLACHKMSEPAFNAHGAAPEALQRSTARLTSMATSTPAPLWARAQRAAFPTHDMETRGLACATCHQEHQKDSTKLTDLTNEQCQSCHAVTFDAFDNHHPAFENYPFTRRTRIIYDHVGHFSKHFPDIAKKDPSRSIPATCSACHESRGEQRIMAIAPFEQTCAACHRDQISGKERVSGPKGIAFLTLPGLDLQSLQTRNARIGEWPDHSEAPLTPFMKAMIGRKPEGLALIKAVDGLNLQDLSQASDAQIKAVTALAWETKSLFFSLISGRTAGVFGDIDFADGTRKSAKPVADLTASIPRDVLIAAQQHGLPNLAAEMANGRGADERSHEGWSASILEVPSAATTTTPAERSTEQPSDPPAQDIADSDATAALGEGARSAQRDPQPCLLRLLGQCLLSTEDQPGADPVQSDGSAGVTGPADARPKVGTTASGVRALPAPSRAGLRDVVVADAPKARAETPASGQRSGDKGSAGADELLVLTEDEQRAMTSRGLEARRSVPPGHAPDGAAGGSDPTSAGPAARAATVMSLQTDLDSESWAEHGGWYQQDHAIYYRPVGHKDKFITAWLNLTESPASEGSASPAAAVRDYLTSKEAPGSCTKCHSVDDIKGRGQIVNFAPLSAQSKQRVLTRFRHEPHFGSVQDRGCLTCHNLERGRPYLKSYEHRNPLDFVSEFGNVSKQACQTCHTSGRARQDCLLCHAYHANGVHSPISSTNLPP